MRYNKIVSIDTDRANRTSRGWIPMGMLHDCTDVGEPAATQIVDNVDGYTMQMLFRGFQPNVTTVPLLRQEILNRNNNLRANEFTTLMNSYGY